MGVVEANDDDALYMSEMNADALEPRQSAQYCMRVAFSQPDLGFGGLLNERMTIYGMDDDVFGKMHEVLQGDKNGYQVGVSARAGQQRIE